MFRAPFFFLTFSSWLRSGASCSGGGGGIGDGGGWGGGGCGWRFGIHITKPPQFSTSVCTSATELVKFCLKLHTDDTYNPDFTVHFSFRQRWVHSPLFISPLQHCIRATVFPGVQDFMQFSLHSALV